MNEFLERIWFDNPVKSYLVVAGVILFAWLLKRLISRSVAGLLFELVHRIWKDVDKRSFTSLVIKPLGLFLAIMVSIVSLHKLKFPPELDAEIYTSSVRLIIYCIGRIILIVSFTSLLIRIIDFVAMILEKRVTTTLDPTDNQLIVFFKDFFKVVFVTIGIILVLRYAFGLNIGGLLTGLSIVGAAIALALRESLENLIASFIIFFDKPFTTGDLVKVNNVTGSVEKIGLRSTRIRTDQKTYVSVPNKQMVDSVLDNLSLRTQRRADLRLELDLRTTTAKLEILLSALKKLMARKEIENANVVLSEITANAIVIQSDYYCAPVAIKEFNSLKQDINLQALKLIEEMGIGLAGNTFVRISGRDH